MQRRTAPPLDFSPPRTDRAFRLGINGWFALTAIFIFMVINFADKALLGIAAEPMSQELGLSPTQYGIISSSFFILYSISSFVVGFLTIRFPAKRILAVLAIIWSIAQAIIVSPLAGYSALILTRVLLGAGEGPAYGTANHAAMQWFPKHRRGMAAAIVGVGVPAGTMVAAPVVGALVAGIGWRETFGILGAASLVWAVLWMLFGREGPYRFDKAQATTPAQATAPAEATDPGTEAVRPDLTAGPAPVHAESTPDSELTKSEMESAAEAESAAADADEAPRKIGSTLLTRTFIGSILGGVAAYWLTVLLIAWVPVYLTTTKGYGPAEVGWAISAPWAVQIVVNLFVVGWLSTFLMKRGVSARVASGVVGSAAITLAGIFLLLFMLFGSGSFGMVLLALAFGVGMCVIPVAQVLIGEISTLRQRGAILGIYTGIYSLTGVIAPALTGAVVEASADPLQGYAIIFGISSALCIVAGIIGMLIINPERDWKRIPLKSGKHLRTDFNGQ